jgi:ribosomal protein L29
MKRKDYTELKGKTIKELIKIASLKRTEAVKKKMQVLGGKEKNLKVYRNLRVEIAKILTLVREKEILEKVQPKEAEAKEQK